MRRLAAVAMAGVLCLCLFTGCGETPLTRQTLALDTVCNVTVYEERDAALIDKAIAHLTAREALWSKTVETSDVARLNRADGQPVTVDPVTAALLQTAVDVTADFGGFDVTTAAVTDVWKDAEQRGTLPAEETLKAALATVGADRLVIDGDTVTLRQGTRIDLGGIAKGQIADELAALLRDGGCDSAMIDLGGNIVAVGAHADGTPFTVGIADPTRENALIATVVVRDAAVVTSGSYERGYTIGGKRYSHILDPASGMPVDNDLASVTVIAASACEADALATACFVKGYKASRALIDSLDGVEAVFVLGDGKVIATAGVTLV